MEVARDAFILSEEQLLVRLLEIERIVEGAPHSRILELLAPGVEHEPLHHAAVADRKLLELDATFFGGGEIVAGCPEQRAVFEAKVDLITFEGFELDCEIAEVLVPDLVEIIAADVDVEILAPVVLDALVDDGATGGEFLDAIRAAAERRLQRRCSDVALLAGRIGPFPPVLGQNGELAENIRKLAVARLVERELNLTLTDLFSLGDMPIIGALARIVLLVCIKGEDHILRGHRHAVMPARLGAQPV